MTKRDVLVAAKGYLVNYGWAREWGRDGGPRCFLGAVESACPLDIWLRAQAAADVLEAAGTKDLASGWNDSRSSVDEVIAALDAAILQNTPEDTPAPQPEPSPSVTHVFA